MHKYPQAFSLPRLILPLLGVFLAVLGTMPAAQARPEKVVRAVLDNGLRVVIVPDPLAPVVTTEINYLVGSNEAPLGFPGTAHAQEHMMFRGSPTLSGAQLADISAAMGGNFDADTRQTVTQYFFTVPAEDMDLALHIGASRMAGVLDSEADWKRERGAIEQEVAQDLSNPEYVFYTKLLAHMFKGTPYAHDALGTRPSFDRTTGDMLKQFYESWYAPNNAILVVAGDVQPAHALKEIRALFGKIPSRMLPSRPTFKLEPVRARTLRITTDRPYGMATVAFRMPGFASPDYAAAQVLADVLSSKRGSLYALVPAGKALDAGFEINDYAPAGMGMAYGIFPRGGDAEALLRAVRERLRHIARHGVPADLVAAAKRQERAAAQFQRNSIAGLASAWSDALAVEGRESPNDDLKAIEKVTVADVNRVARTYLDQDHAISAILTPQSSGKPVSGKGFGGAESFAPKQTKAVTLPTWAATALHRLKVPASAVHPTVTTLPNGLRLIVQPETVSDTVSVYGHVRNRPGMETPKGEEGVDKVLGALFDYGSTHLDRMAFQKALDAIGASESAGTDFSVQVLAADFDRGVQLLADNELHPALPKPAFDIVRRQTAAAVAGELQSPAFQMHHSLRAALFPAGDPSLREATGTSVSHLSLKDVRNYYEHTFRPDLTTIVVIGKVSPKQAQAVIGKYFGAWHAQGKAPDTVLPAVPANKPAVLAVPDASRVQDNVVLAETLGLTRSNPDYYALELGNHVLGGAFYATRLYRDLREHNGLVYYVGSQFEVGRKRSVYLVNYACDPPNVNRARTIVTRDLRTMTDSPVTAAELRQAKALLLREIPLGEASVDSIAAGLIHRSTEGLPLDEPTRAARHYVALTAHQVEAAYHRWLRPDDLVQVTLGPKPH